MKDDSIVVVFMNPVDATDLIKTSPEASSALVISEIIPKGEAIVVPFDEFAEFLTRDKEILDGDIDEL